MEEARIMMTPDEYGAAFKKGFERTLASLIACGAQYDDARETAQEAWTRGWERIWQLRDERYVVPWVNAIARSLFLTSFRRPQFVSLSHQNHLQVAAPPVNLAAIDMTRAVQSCKPNERQFLEPLLEGYSFLELAVKTGRSLGAVHAKVYRLRRTLQDQMRLNSSGSAERKRLP
jgi:DNA-directed RNA polymerase specialized sigma24 family protein